MKKDQPELDEPPMATAFLLLSAMSLALAWTSLSGSVKLLMAFSSSSATTRSPLSLSYCSLSSTANPSSLTS
ncbi:hypothetical protein AKJ16_DCAP20191 [Drosera capensis]